MPVSHVKGNCYSETCLEYASGPDSDAIAGSDIVSCCNPIIRGTRQFAGRCPGFLFERRQHPVAAC